MFTTGVVSTQIVDYRLTGKIRTMKEGAFVITILKAILYTVLLLFFLFLPVGGLHLVVFFIIYVCPILIPLLLVLWLFSEKKEPTSVNENHSVMYTGAVSGTPVFAMSEITRSIQEQDGELFLQFVDVDGILTDVEKKIPGMWAAQLKQQLMEEITSGKAKMSGQNRGPVMFLFDNWVVGGIDADKSAAPASKSPIVPLGLRDPRCVEDMAWVSVKVDSARTSVSLPEDSWMKFQLNKLGSEYKVVACEQTTDALVDRYKKYIATPRTSLEPQDKQEEQEEKEIKECQSLIEYEIKAVRPEFEERYRNADLKTLIAEGWPHDTLDTGETNYVRPQVIVSIKNAQDRVISRLQFKVIFRESAGERRYWTQAYMQKDFGKENSIFAPFTRNEVKFELKKLKIAEHYYLSTGAYQVEIFPTEIIFIDL